MTTADISTQTEIFVDQAHALFSYSAETLQINGLSAHLPVRQTLFSEMKKGRFRKIFNRHGRALL